jgi:tetratricopeptide (TPR) repeat protein
LRGLVHEKSGDYQAALKDIDRAIGLDPEYGAAYYSRANLHSNMGNEDRATKDIEIFRDNSDETTLCNRNSESIFKWMDPVSMPLTACGRVPLRAPTPEDLRTIQLPQHQPKCPIFCLYNHRSGIFT